MKRLILLLCLLLSSVAFSQRHFSKCRQFNSEEAVIKEFKTDVTFFADGKAFEFTLTTDGKKEVYTILNAKDNSAGEMGHFILWLETKDEKKEPITLILMNNSAYGMSMKFKDGSHNNYYQ